MKKIANSKECIKSELDLFLTPPTNTSILNGGWTELNPTSSISSGTPIEFKYEGTSEYVQLSKTSLYIVVSVSNNNKLVNENDIVSPVNNLLHSLFSQVELSFNGSNFENSNNVYPYKAYITDLLNYGQDAKNSFLQNSLFYKDDAGEMENFNIIKSEQVLNLNSGLISRKRILTKGKGTIELIGRIHCDIFNSDRYLLNNVSMNIKFIPNSSKFCLMADEKSDYKISINKAVLMVRTASINEQVMLGHALALQKTSAKYPIKRVVVKNYTISSGISSEIITNLNQSLLPSRVVIGFIQNNAFNGNYALNPFNFQNFNISSINLRVNGQSIPYYTPLKFNFDENLYLRGYYTLFEGIDKPVFATGNDISREDYPNGYTLFAFDLTPDLCSGDQFNMIKSGNLDLSLEFGKNLNKAIVAIIYMEYDNMVEIDNKYEVSYDYKV